MKKLLNISLLGAILVLFAIGCKQKPLPEAKLYPAILNASVPSLAYAQVAYEYKVDDITGADFNWTVVGILGEEDGDTTAGWQGVPTDEVVNTDYASTCTIEYPYDFSKSIASITMGATDTSIFVQVIVTATTENGSEADTFAVEVAPFCPPSGYDVFNGTDVTATDTLGLDVDGSKPVCAIATDESGNAKILIDGYLANLFRSWDDNGAPELHDTIPATIDLKSPLFEGAKKWLYAHTVEGGDDWYYYFENVNGYYDNCGDQIQFVVKYQVHYISEDAGYDGYFSKGAYYWVKFTIANGKVVSVDNGIMPPLPYMEAYK